MNGAQQLQVQKQEKWKIDMHLKRHSCSEIDAKSLYSSKTITWLLKVLTYSSKMITLLSKLSKSPIDTTRLKTYNSHLCILAAVPPGGKKFIGIVSR